MDWQKEDLKYIWHPCSQMKDYETLPPIVIERGEGINLYDINGKCYKDVISSWWCNLLGHCNPRINAAIKKQVDTLEHVIFANFSHKTAITLCQELMKVLPKGLCKFNFADNGSSAIEMSLKMSFQYHYQTGNPQKKRFMALSDAYHGETLGALAVGGVDLYSELYKPLLLDVIRIDGPDCYRCPYGKQCEGHCNSSSNTLTPCHCECFEKAEEAFSERVNKTMKKIRDNIDITEFGEPGEAPRKAKNLKNTHIFTVKDRNGKKFYRVISPKFREPLDLGYTDAEPPRVQTDAQLLGQKVAKSKPAVPANDSSIAAVLDNQEKQFAKIANDALSAEQKNIESRKSNGGSGTNIDLAAAARRAENERIIDNLNKKPEAVEELQPDLIGPKVLSYVANYNSGTSSVLFAHYLDSHPLT